MAQQVKVFATKPGNLSLVPGMHMAEGKNYQNLSEYTLA